MSSAETFPKHVQTLDPPRFNHTQRCLVVTVVKYIEGKSYFNKNLLQAAMESQWLLGQNEFFPQNHLPMSSRVQREFIKGVGKLLKRFEQTLRGKSPSSTGILTYIIYVYIRIFIHVIILYNNDNNTNIMVVSTTLDRGSFHCPKSCWNMIPLSQNCTSEVQDKYPCWTDNSSSGKNCLAVADFCARIVWKGLGRLSSSGLLDFVWSFSFWDGRGGVSTLAVSIGFGISTTAGLAKECLICNASISVVPCRNVRNLTFLYCHWEAKKSICHPGAPWLR